MATYAWKNAFEHGKSEERPHKQPILPPLYGGKGGSEPYI